MKKIIPFLLIGYISVIGGLNCASAQKLQNGITFKSLNPEKMEPVQPDVENTTTLKPEAESDIPSINISKKALNDFQKSFKNATDARWFETKEGNFMASFSTGSIKTRAYYHKKGKLLCTILDYTEENLPKDIRHLVKSTFYDFSIYYIHEVTIDSQTAYLITLEGKTTWKKIRVIDGEIVEDLNYVKG